LLPFLPLTQTSFAYLNGPDFIAYDEKFFDILGPNASVEHLHTLPYQVHEASCYNPSTGNLFFVEWGPPGGDNGTHNWQYLLRITENNTLIKIQTDPPLYNVHGCVIYNNSMYVVTDGSHNETGKLARIDPITFKQETILNNYYGQPFMGLNDVDVDPAGNFYFTDSIAGVAAGLTPWWYPTNPSVYFVNATTMRPRAVKVTPGSANGVAVAKNMHGEGHTVYLAQTSVSDGYPKNVEDISGDRSLYSYTTSPHSEGLLNNPVLLNNPISYFYDGVRASRNGWIFAGAGDGVDVIDPATGLTLGTIRLGGGKNRAVNLAFGKHEMWIVGAGGVWHVKGVRDELTRAW